MAQFMSNLLTASLHGSIVILAVILLRLILRKTPKKYICLLWLLAGIRLLIPIEIRSDLSLQPEFVLPGWNLPAILPWAWGIVAICFGIYSMVSYIKLKAKVREAVRIRGGWECDRIDTAFILGFIKPRIYIPMGMDKQARKHILEHERTHLDKGDHWIKMIGFLALALHWFNPLVWMAYIMLCKDIEMACDERVVQFMELEERKSYSAALLSCSGKQMHLSANPVAFGEVSVKQRILSVLNYKKPSFWISFLGVAAFFFVAVCLLTSPAKTEVAAVEPLTPEQQVQATQLEKCLADVEALLERSEFYYDINGTDARGSANWYVRLYRQGDNTMWTYYSSGRGNITEGRLELDGKHYAWQYGQWMETDTADTRFAEWLDLFRWDPATAQYIAQEQYEDATGHVFTTHWEDADKTVYMSAVTCAYDMEGKLQNVRVDQPDHPSADHVYLSPNPWDVFYDGAQNVSQFFAEAEAAIAEGFVTEEDLQTQAEFDSWGIYFRVDDDRLSSMGSDVYFSQDEYGYGTISTTDRYWLEKKVDGRWEPVPEVSKPQWTEQGIGVAKGSSTYGYLDWTPIYGKLESGQYRMGKIFHCYDSAINNSKSHTFYSEFEIMESVDAASPEAQAAVERCYAKLEELKKRETIHWQSVSGSDSTQEYWVNDGNYLRTMYWPGPEVPQDQWSEHDKTLFPRTDRTVRYDGILYADAREDPEVLTSKVLGMKVISLNGYADSWDASAIENDFNMSFFDRSNHIITFPDGVGVVSDEMVRFQTNWAIAGGMECAAQLTYRFDDNGDLCYMEYQSDLDEGRVYTAYIEIFDDSAEEIDAVIKPYTENLIIDSFSWEQARAKYTADVFNIREDKFINTGSADISGPVEAARLALKEYPNLSDYLSLDVFRDDTTGMWKVTIEAYVDYQSTYCYRDVYLTDSGETRLLVYEGPIGWEEERK